MAYEESEENINLALMEVDAIRNNINKAGKSKDLIFDKYAKACSLFSCAGELTIKKDSKDMAFYDSTNSSKSKYFVSEEDTSEYNNIFNAVNFFLTHAGSSEQFATALSMVFANDNHIRSYPVKLKLKMNNEEDGFYDDYRFINFTQFFDDFGTLVHSCFIDLFDNIENYTSLDELIKVLQTKISDGGEKCVGVEVVGVNIFPSSIDLKKNFTIFESLTDMGGVDFNFFGYQLDYANADAEKCANLKNYVTKKQLKEHLNTYLAIGNELS